MANIERVAPRTLPDGYEDAAVKSLKNDTEWMEPLPIPGVAETGQLSQEDILYNTLAEAGGEQSEGFVSIFRIHPDGKKKEWLIRKENLEFQKLGLPFLAERFGAGDYEIMIYSANGTIYRRPRVTIGKEAVAPSVNGSADISRVMEVMNANFTRLAETLARSAQPAAPVQSRTEMLNEMLLYKQLFGGGGQDQMGSLKSMMEIVRSVMPRPEGAESTGYDLLMKLADSFAPMLASAVEKMPAALTLPAAAVAAAPAQRTLPVAPPAQTMTPEQIGAQQMGIKLKMQLVYLCSEAKADSDPGPYAELIVDKVSTDFLNKFVNSEGWLSELAKIHPGVLEHEVWFSELREEVAALLSGDSDSLTGNQNTGTDGEINPDDSVNVPGDPPEHQ